MDRGVSGAGSLDPEAGLRKQGAIDSIELMQVMTFLEQEFGIQVDETEILPENLRSLSTIAAFVERKRSQAG